MIDNGILEHLQVQIGRPRPTTMARLFATCSASALILVPCVAFGDEPPPTTTPAPTATTEPAPAPTVTAAPPVAPVAPVAPPAPAAPPKPVFGPSVPDKPVVSPLPDDSNALPTDHQLVVGALGIGYAGMHSVPIPIAVPVGRGDEAGMIPNDTLSLQQLAVPMLGLRKWFSKRYGFDAAIGINVSGGSRAAVYGQTEVSIDKASVFALSLRAGVPLMVADTRHMAFTLIPEATIGFSASNVAAEFENNAPPPVQLRGGAVDVGLRAGAELHFGFMGLPRLSLQAGVGLYVHAQWVTASVAEQALADTSVSFSAGSMGEPWNIFSGVSYLAARYYF